MHFEAYCIFPQDFMIYSQPLKTTAKVDEKWSRSEAGPGLQNVAFSRLNLAHLANLRVLFVLNLINLAVSSVNDLCMFV